MTEEKFIKDFTFTIRKIGKKWIQAIRPNLDRVYMVQLNAETTGFAAGGTYTIPVLKLTERSRFGIRSKYIPVSAADLPGHIRKDIERWIGSIEHKAQEGWLHKWAVQTAIGLGVSQHQDLDARLQAAILLASREKGRKNIQYIACSLKKIWYETGEDHVLEAITELRSLNDNDEADRLAAELEKLAQASGRTVKQVPGNTAQPNESSATAPTETNNSAEAKSAAKQIEEIAQMIMAEGERPASMHTMASEPFFPTPESEEDVMYGGGWWFLFEPDGSLWYRRNNSADGNNSSTSNVATWGTGAIGWKMSAENPKTTPLSKEISRLALPFNRTPKK